MVQLQIPTQLRSHTGGQATLEVKGGTVRSILDGLEEGYADLKKFLLSPQGVHRHINIYLGEEDIRFLDGLDTEVSDGSEVIILPAISGGGKLTW